jgi:hypothetical protein
MINFMELWFKGGWFKGFQVLVQGVLDKGILTQRIPDYIFLIQKFF